MRIATGTALIVDDDDFFRIAVSKILTSALGFSKVLEASDFDHGISLLSENEVSLAVFDLIMPGMAGAGSLKGVRDCFPDLCLVMATSSRRRQDVFMALQAGVNGYIPKSMGAEELSSALKQIIGGKVYVPALIASPGILDPTDEIAAAAASELDAHLTPRQKDVLKLVVKGNSNKAIARELGLGEGTVKVHLAALFRILGVSSRSAAAVEGARIIPKNP